MSHMSSSSSTEHPFHAQSVYEPAEDSWLLVDTLSSDEECGYLSQHLLRGLGRPLVCMEIGSGSGYVLAYLHNLLKWLGSDRVDNSDKCDGNGSGRRRTHMFIASDINRHAVQATAMTLEKNRVKCWDVLCMNLADGFLQRARSSDGCGGGDSHSALKVDILIFNPPYVPTPQEEVSCCCCRCCC